jgi:hypothetical protein
MNKPKPLSIYGLLVMIMATAAAGLVGCASLEAANKESL